MLLARLVRLSQGPVSRKMSEARPIVEEVAENLTRVVREIDEASERLGLAQKVSPSFRLIVVDRGPF